ncbi:MAG: glycogen debranching protein GlgX [Actinocrinis sp.]
MRVTAQQGPPAWPGHHEPLGATWSAESTNFAVWAPEATRVDVCVLDEEGAETRHQLTECTLGIWHGAVPDIDPGRRYGYRADGPWAPEHGLRFNPAKLLLDPYARAVSGTVNPVPTVYGYQMPIGDPPARDDADSLGSASHGVVTHDEFDWGDDAHPVTKWNDTVIYELHVKGFTELHDRVPEELRGTYAGLTSPAAVDYLKDLGVTTIELLPVHEFVPEPALTERGLTNYWGYNSIGYFAPHGGYSSSGDRGQQIHEFKAMVKALHAAGLEVILDVVYNHTAEGSPEGPTLSFRGLDDVGYYKHATPADYWDCTGCGNTVDASYAPALRLILDSLRYWATEMHVDGFRFDLTSALTRTGTAIDLKGHFLTSISQDPVLRQVKLVAEPWDASSDGYMVGRFPPPWCEWNDHYRDTIRDFWRGQSEGIRDVATRLAGSSDLYADDGRAPYASINFVTAHDGFTMRDVVTYDHKHNEAHGEDNRDGNSDNRSSNYGVEGETDDEKINELRRRQIRNVMATLVLSTGVPMITAGDEFGRTQRGDNNAYCVDDETSWVDWSLLEKGEWSSLLDMTRRIVHLRKYHPVLRQRVFFSGQPAHPGGLQDIAWFRPDGEEMTDGDWFAPASGLGVYLSGQDIRGRGPHGERISDDSFLLVMHAGAEELEFMLPGDPWARWYHSVIDTTLEGDPGARDNVTYDGGLPVTLAPRSLLLLRADPEAWSAT